MIYPNIDILDENGELTGESKTFAEIHKNGYWHGGAHVWIINSKNELLMQRRGPNVASHPNMWDPSASGHIDEGETGASTALKEAEEELGIELEEHEIEHLFRCKDTYIVNSGTFINNEYIDVYLVRKDLELSELNPGEEEVSELRLIHYKELEKLVNDKDESIAIHEEEYKKLFKILHKRLDRKKEDLYVYRYKS